MSTFVFSDTHFTKKFDQKRFDLLVELINKADRIIINGDFWEGLHISFDDFLNSKWNKLLPLLKSKKTIYIYGNHDHKSLSDDRVSRFCDQIVHDYTLETPKRTYFFTHGFEFLFPKRPVNKPGDWELKKTPFTQTIRHIAEIIQRIMFKILGANAYPTKFNQMTYKRRESITSMNNLLVCGHSHTPQYQKDLNFIDIGFFNYGYANYMLIDDDGEFEFKQERY